MAARSIASLTLSFGLVSIPVKLYSATETSSAVRFNLLAKDGSRLKQQYVSEKDPTQVVPRAEMVKGYEFEKDRFVLCTPEELKAAFESGKIKPPMLRGEHGRRWEHPAPDAPPAGAPAPATPAPAL